MGWEGDLTGAPGFCKECGKNLKTSLHMKRHIVVIHMPGGWEVCGRRLKPSRQLQDHKTEHSKIVVLKYLPTLAVHLSLLGMEVSMCNLSIV